jgi:cell division septation protein DedD
MAGNRPARERFEFSLDARQVAAVILGSFAALGLAFFLGHALGQRVAERPVTATAPAPPAASADRLAALDPVPSAGGEDKLTFHDTLTSPRPPQDVLPPGPKGPTPEPRPVPVAAARPPEPKPVPAAAARPPEAKAQVGAQAPAAAAAGPVVAGAALVVPPPAAPSSKVANAKAPEAPSSSGIDAKGAPAPKAAVAAPPPRAVPVPSPAPARTASTAGKGAWVVQVGSTQDRIEADRIAARFATRGARVVVAEVPGKGRWYRVRLGSFESREVADRYLRDLERTTGAKGFVASAN